MNFKPLLISATLVAVAFGTTNLLAADFSIDPLHSFVQFKIQHLGYSWLYGRFDGVTGHIKYDLATPAASSIEINVDTKTVNTNWPARDKHLRSADFFDVEKFGVATFKSTSFKGDANGGRVAGVLSFHGVEKPIEVAITKIGEGKDPWGGYRAGFQGTYVMTRKDFGVNYDLGPASTTVELEIGLEGVRK